MAQINTRSLSSQVRCSHTHRRPLAPTDTLGCTPGTGGCCSPSRAVFGLCYSTNTLSQTKKTKQNMRLISNTLSLFQCAKLVTAQFQFGFFFPFFWFFFSLRQGCEEQVFWGLAETRTVLRKKKSWNTTGKKKKTQNTLLKNLWGFLGTFAPGRRSLWPPRAGAARAGRG